MISNHAERSNELHSCCSLLVLHCHKLHSLQTVLIILLQVKNAASKPVQMKGWKILQVQMMVIKDKINNYICNVIH
jgi:hypothetical protein